MPELQSGETVQAYFEAAPVTIRVLGVENDSGDWTEKVQIVDPEPGTIMTNGRVKEGDADVITVHEGRGLEAASFYNHLIQPFVRRELYAARDRLEEAKEQGDVIEAHNAASYIEELEETLDDVE